MCVKCVVNVCIISNVCVCVPICSNNVCNVCVCMYVICVCVCVCVCHVCSNV
jgi:hypothetical protein